jgi:hypothetical protein
MRVGDIVRRQCGPFVLNAGEPYYFQMGVTTIPPHSGTYTTFLGEMENARSSAHDLPISRRTPPHSDLAQDHPIMLLTFRLAAPPNSPVV